jgi:hypothetical protein
MSLNDVFVRAPNYVKTVNLDEDNSLVKNAFAQTPYEDKVQCAIMGLGLDGATDHWQS